MNTSKVLLVDDVNFSLEMGKDVLSDSGAIILTASNGLEALEIVKNEKPNIVLSDVFMPEMNGDELCKTIKADPSLKHIPVILFTAYFDHENTDGHELRSMCDDILVKPYKSRELLEMVYKYVSINMREHKRKPVNYKVDYNVREETLSGEIADISLGGMLIKSTMALPVDSEISFCVYIDRSEDCSPVLGKVVWSDNQHMGVKFISSSSHVKNLLNEAV